MFTSSKNLQIIRQNDADINYFVLVHYEIQGWFWIENKMTENQWK